MARLILLHYFMLKTIIHGVNLARNAFRDVGNPVKRSPKWEKLEHEFKLAHPSCAACGSINRLNIHHIKPFHVSPELELDPNNLITMCMDTKECHLKLAHLGSFKTANSNIIVDAAHALKHPEKFDEIIKFAKAHYLVIN